MAKFVLTAEIVLQAPKNVNQVVNNIQSQLNNIQANVNIQGASAANKQIQQLTKSTNQASSAAQKMGKSFTASVRRFSALAIATRAVSLFTNTLGGAIRESIAFERELVKVSQVTGKSIQQLQNLTNTISDLSTGLGVSSTSLLSVSRILAQTGLSAKDTQIALSTLAKTELAPTFDNIQQTAEGAVAILNQFGEGAGALEAQLGSLNAVAGQFAVEAGDLVAVIRRTGGVFKSAGGDLNELIALFTSVRATTRESAESIATGLRTIFTRIQRPETIDYLRQFGVELTDIEGKFVGPYEATRRLSQALAGLGERDLTFVEIAEQLGGFRQIGKVLPLLQQFSVAQDALKAAQEGQGSLADDAAKAQAALAVQIVKVKEEFLELIRNITSSTAFQTMADTVLSLASAMIKLADALSPVLPLLGAFAAIKIGSVAVGAAGNLGKTLGFNDGGQVPHAGKVHYFASGGMVPGNGNGDTVPAMLTPGEFVIKKSSVKKLGAENLSEMNSGGKVATYGNGTGTKGASIYDVKVRDGAVGGFFLNPDKGTDREFPINVRNAGLLTNPNVLAQLKGKAGATIDEQLASLGDAARGRVFGFKNVSDSARKAQLKQTNFGSSSPVKKPGGGGNITFKDLGKEGKDRLAREVNTASSTTRSEAVKIDKITGRGAGYLPGKDIEQNAQVSATIAKATSDILKSGVEQAAQQIQALASFGGTIRPKKGAITGADRLAADPNATASVEGFLYEGVIDSLTGAELAGNQAAFDFPYSSIKGNRAGLKAFFSPTEGLGNLINADAKRSFSLAPTIGPKVLGDLNAGNTKGYELIKKFAKGGAAKGKDTVPAMLTPGEFVVNQKSAKKIGYGNLHRMNKVGKYAKGGVVKRYGNGTGSGGVPSGGSSGGGSFDVSGLQAALDGLATSVNEVMAELQAYANASTAATKSTTDFDDAAQGSTKSQQTLTKTNEKGEGSSLKLFAAMSIATTAVQLLTPEIDETSGAFDYIANSVSQTAMQFVVLAGLLAQFGILDKVAAGFGQLVSFSRAASDGLASAASSAVNSGKAMLGMQGATAAAAATTNLATATTKVSIATKLKEIAASIFATGAAIAKAMADLLGAGIVGAVIGTLLIAAAGFAALATIVGLVTSGLADYNKKLKEQAIEEGDVNAAGEAASNEFGYQATTDSLWRMATVVGIVGETMSLLNGDFTKARKAAVSAARADAALQKTTDSLAKSGEEAASAFKQFEDGTISAGEALSRTTDAGEDVIKSQREVAQANMEAQRAVVTWYSSVGTFFENLIGWSLGLPTIEGNQKKADAEGKARESEQKKKEAEYISQNAKATSALMKQVAAGGGTIDDFYAKLATSNDKLFKLIAGTEATEEAFKNIAEEAERTRAAFEAMNLGLQSFNAAVGAYAVGVDNLLRGVDASSPLLESAVATLAAGVTSAAQGMDPNAFGKAMNEVTSQMAEFEGDPDAIKKFEENMSAINQAQRNYADATDEMKAKMRADFQRGMGRGSSDDQRKILAQSIANNLGDVGDEVKQRIISAIEGMDIDEDALNRFNNEGDISVLDEVLGDLGEDTMKQVQESFNKLIQVNAKLAAITQKIVALEEELVSAKRKTIDTEIEARELEEKYGGRSFSRDEKEDLILSKGNVSSVAGMPKYTDGSPEEMKARDDFMRGELNEIGETRRLAASNEAGSDEARREIRTEEFQQREANASRYVDDEIKLRKQLLKNIDDEIKAVEAKEAAEKKAADALLGNSWEEFVDQMAANGAVAAVATGDQRLMSGYSRSDFGRGSKDLETMEKAGVKDMYGVDINDLNKDVRTEGIMRGGLDRESAEELGSAGIGESDEVKGLKAKALPIAQSLPNVQKLEEKNVQNQIDENRQLLKATQKLKKAVLENTAALKGEKAESEDESKKGEGADGKGGAGAGAAGGGSGKDGMDVARTSSITHADCCCGDVSSVKVVNPDDFPQPSDADNQSMAAMLATNPVAIDGTMKAINGLKKVLPKMMPKKVPLRNLEAPRGKLPAPKMKNLEAPKPKMNLDMDADWRNRQYDLPEGKPRPRIADDIIDAKPKNLDLMTNKPRADQVLTGETIRAGQAESFEEIQQKVKSKKKPTTRKTIDPTGERVRGPDESAFSFGFDKLKEKFADVSASISDATPKPVKDLLNKLGEGASYAREGLGRAGEFASGMVPQQVKDGIGAAGSFIKDEIGRTAEFASSMIPNRVKDGAAGAFDMSKKVLSGSADLAVQGGKGLLSGGKSVMTSLGKFMKFLGPIADVADVAVGGYTGYTRTEADRGNLKVDEGLDEQSKIYKTGIGALTGTSTLGGSVFSELSGMMGGPQAEVGGTLDQILAGQEAVLRGATIGATAGSFLGPAGTLVGGAVGAGVGGTAELVKAVGLLQGDMKKARESEAKVERLRSASVDETGLDAVTRNLVNAKAQMELDLEDAKASGDEGRIKDAETALANSQVALDKRMQERSTGKGDLVARNTRGQKNNSKTERNIKEDLENQEKYFKKVKEAGKLEREDAKEVEDRKKDILKMQEDLKKEAIEQNKVTASEATSGTFDYRTGQQISTGNDMLTGLDIAMTKAMEQKTKAIEAPPAPGEMETTATTETPEAKVPKEMTITGKGAGVPQGVAVDSVSALGRGNKGEITTGGAFDNGQFSSANPFVGDSGAVEKEMTAPIAEALSSVMQENTASLGSMLSLAETNTILSSIDATLKKIETNTAVNVDGQPQAQASGGSNTDFAAISSSFQTIFTSFTNDFTNAIARLENVSIEIKIQPINVTVDLNGGGVLDKLKTYVGDELLETVAKEIKNYKVGTNNKLVRSQSTLSNGGGGGF